MAVLLLQQMSGIPLPNHMTSPHGSSVPDVTNVQFDSTTRTGSKKPKLSLQTSTLAATYETPSKAAGPIPALATYTPTTANTFSNTWDLSMRPSPTSRTQSPRYQAPITHVPQQPYTISLPFGVKPILKNSPLSRQTSVSASPRDSKRKIFFPQPKKVGFKNILEEAIKTKEYVARHVDLSSSEDEASSEDVQTDSSCSTPSEEGVPGYSSPPPSRKRKSRRDSGIGLSPTDTTASAVHSRDKSSATPTRRSKRRKWQWTIAAASILPDPLQAAEVISVSTDGIEGNAYRKIIATEDDASEPEETRGSSLRGGLEARLGGWPGQNRRSVEPEPEPEPEDRGGARAVSDKNS